MRVCGGGVHSQNQTPAGLIQKVIMTLFYTKKHQRFGSKSSHHPCLYVAHVQHVHPGMVGKTRRQGCERQTRTNGDVSFLQPCQEHNYTL